MPAQTAPRCPACNGRVISHPELFTLTIAHVDCDAFFCSVEKRDRPELIGRPVLVGGGRRGVVAAACYVSRLHGVRSAMPMWQALRACPDAVVIRPDFDKYSAAAREIRTRMEALTPIVQTLSIDEAVLDLSGTEAVHGMPPAATLARFARQVETEMRLTVSIGLAGNRMLAKIAAERDKPRGFAVLGTDAAAILAGEKPDLLPGIGPVQARRLTRLGITHLGQLQVMTEAEAMRRLGEEGPALVRRARGEDARTIRLGRESRSVSAETTFGEDLATLPALEARLWPLAERLAIRLREKDLAAGGVVLKLKTARHASRTRTVRLPGPTRLPDRLFAAARILLAREADGTPFRLIGIGANPLQPGGEADRADLADPEIPRKVATQTAIDALRARFGTGAIGRGRGWRGRNESM